MREQQRWLRCPATVAATELSAQRQPKNYPMAMRDEAGAMNRSAPRRLLRARRIGCLVTGHSVFQEFDLFRRAEQACGRPLRGIVKCWRCRFAQCRICTRCAILWAYAKCAVLTLSARRAADRRVRFIAVAGAVLLDVSVYCVLTLSASRSTPASGGPAGPFHRPRQKR